MIALRMYGVDLGARDATGQLVATLRKRLSEHYQPALEPGLAAIARIFGAESTELRSRVSSTSYYDRAELLDGEIFVDQKKASIFVMYWRDATTQPMFRVPPQGPKEDKTRLTISFISTEWDFEAQPLPITIAEEVLGTKLALFTYASKRFDELKAEGREATGDVQQSELDAANLLQDRILRTLAIAIKSSGGMLIRDLSKQLPVEHRDSSDALVSRLKQNQLVDSEVVVVCAKTQAQVARVPNREAIQAMAKLGMKCACGRSVADEKIEEALTITDLGRNLLDKARWLTILVVEQLKECGISLSAILVEQSVGGDEIDCLANISGELVLFELKDKEFSLGNAYSFGAKVAIIKPKHRVVITTEHIGGDAREHFKRAILAESDRDDVIYTYPGVPQKTGANEIQYIEGVENIGQGIRSLVDTIYRSDVVSLLDNVAPILTVGGAQILKSFEKAASQEEGTGQAPARKARVKLAEAVVQVPDPNPE